MRVNISIDLDNAAFEPTPGEEVARILSLVGDRALLTGEVEDQKLLDLNGNTVGQVLVTGG